MSRGTEPVEPADPLQAAQHFIDSDNPGAAEELLLEFVTGMPPGWRPATESPRRRAIAFWDMAEFMSYVGHRQDEPDERPLMWQGPSYSKAWYTVAFIRVERQELEGALAAIEQSLALEPDHPTALAERGLILSGLKRHEEALAAYRQAAAARDWATPRQQGRALRGAGVALIDLWRLDEAEDVLRQSLAVEPENGVALNELVYITQLRSGADPTRHRVVRTEGDPGQ